MTDIVGPYRSVLWLYGKGHLDHPFIVLSIRSLLDCGCKVTMLDAQGVPEHGHYSGIAVFDPEPAYERWDAIKEISRTYLGGLQRRAQQPINAYFHRSKTGGWRDIVDRWRLIEVIPLYMAIRFISLLRFFLRVWAKVQLAGLGTWKPNLASAWYLLVSPCDVIVASRPFECIIAFVAARLRGKRFVYYPFELYGEQHNRFSRATAYLERKMLRFGVDTLVTQNGHRSDVYRKRGAAIDSVIVRNFKPYRAARGGRLRASLGLRQERRIVLYEGGLTAGRWLDNLARASLLFHDDVILVMLGNGNTWWQNHAPEFISEPQAKGKLVVLGAVPHDSLLDYVADADVGVIIYDDAVLNNIYCEPGKLSDYVHAGVPVIAPDFPTISPLIKELGIGVCFQGGTPKAIAAAVHAVLEKGRQAWQPALVAARVQLDWATQAPALVSAITGGTRPVASSSGDGSRRPACENDPNAASTGSA